MLTWIIQCIFLSIILIFLVHHLIHFFKSTLTVPKIKDLVNTSSQKYENIYNIIKNSKTETLSDEIYTLNDLLPSKPEISMKNELKNFLKKQLHSINESENINSDNNNGTSIVSLDELNEKKYSFI